MNEAINISNLRFEYDKDSKVFSNLSLSVEKGEYVALIGHNGSGKSTLAKLIIGLLAANSGKIVVFGQELNEKTVYEVRSKVGIIFQNPDNQFTGATVEDDIAFGLENKCVPQNEMEGIIHKYASLVGMEQFLKKEPSALSGGQKQRVAIAGVLAMNPSLIIMDESTAMLDPRGKREIRDVVKTLRKQNPDLTILSITHDVEEAYDSDRVIVINHGEVMYNDTPKNVFAHEKELMEIHLDVPFVYKIKNALDKEGIALDTLDEKEMVDKLCQ
jgi:energy-coupling factor transport system ATP-binding protein